MYLEILVVKAIGLELQPALNEIIKMVNYIKTRALNQKYLQSFVKKMVLILK